MTTPIPLPPDPKRKKGFLLRGLITMLPAVFTIFILVMVVQFVDRWVASPINNAIYTVLDGNGLGWQALGAMGVDPYSLNYLDSTALPSDLLALRERVGLAGKEFTIALAELRAQEETFLRDYTVLAIDAAKVRAEVKALVHPLIGVGLSLLLVLFLGYLASGYFGRRLVSMMERGLRTIPVIKSVYPYTKQVVDFFLADSTLEFDSVVAAPYPSEGIWSVGFVTGPGLKTIREKGGGQFISIFMPTSPMPLTGFTIFIEAERLIPLDLSVDEAFRVTVSGGVLIPPSETVENLTTELERRLTGSAESPTESTS
ncbi:MAG: hypothetical protein CMK00_06310 [Planctomycetes bacterium]|jgi:uncharacterized membrane protein|nr:hypothetical protein [Planctomycetota bacterium]HJO27695.1 DUF502 domain-containing protein [Planctomycetota bacterium]